MYHVCISPCTYMTGEQARGEGGGRRHERPEGETQARQARIEADESPWAVPPDRGRRRVDLCQ